MTDLPPADVLASTLARTVEERDALLEALRRYGRHAPDCRKIEGISSCTCGFDDAWHTRGGTIS